MADLLKGIIGSISRLLLNWVWPLLLAALTFFYLLVLPSFSDVAQNLFTDTGATFAVLLAFGSLTGGFIMSALSTSLYRVLEGYYWPRQIRDWGKKKQKRRIETLRTRANVAEGVEQALIFEQLSRFPADTLQLAPTAFGNAMRAFETFGVDRYCLDSQGFWAELTNVVPTGLRDEVGRSRAAVDFFVSLTFVSGVFAVANFVAFFSIDSAPRFLIAAAVGLLAIPACYRGALSSTAYWRNTVYAVVNLGRKPLAEGLGLDLPPTLEQERTMWERVAGFSFYPFDPAWIDTLDEFRTGKPAPAPLPEPLGFWERRLLRFQAHR